MGLGLKTFTGKTGRNGLQLKAQNCLFDIEMGLKGQPEDVMGPRYYFEIYLNFGKKSSVLMLLLSNKVFYASLMCYFMGI